MQFVLVFGHQLQLLYVLQSKQQSQMGATNESSSDSSNEKAALLLSQLQPYEEITTQIFGPLKVFRQTQKPYKYIMMYSQNGIDDRSTLLRMQQKLTWYKSLKPHPHIVEIQGIRLLQRSQMCIKKISLQLYCKYYNHTLEMAIQRKIKRNKRFKEADFFYVLNSLLDTWKHINEFLNNKYIEIFTVKHIYITPEGFVKVYPFPIDLGFVSSPLKPKKTTHSHTHSFLNSQEVLMDNNIKRTEQSIKMSTTPKPRRQLSDKDNLRDIGIIIFQLVLLSKELQFAIQFSPQKQYQLLTQLQHQKYISPYLRQILVLLLQKYKQTTYEELKFLIGKYKGDLDRPISTNIKLEEGPEFVEQKQVEKTSHLQRLTEHQHLKTGIISIMSKKRANQVKE